MNGELEAGWWGSDLPLSNIPHFFDSAYVNLAHFTATLSTALVTPIVTRNYPGSRSKNPNSPNFG
jgi:hypothetical protein